MTNHANDPIPPEPRDDAPCARRLRRSLALAATILLIPGGGTQALGAVEPGHDVPPAREPA